ncbi:MAG: energy transducer TonB [Candidatus Acidiferrales bacterium]
MLLAAVFTLAVTVAAQQPSNSSAAPTAAAALPAPPGPLATISASIPPYPDTAKGLENLVKKMLRLYKEGDQQKLAQYENSLTLPDSDRWFKSVFGDDLGGRMTAISAPARADAEVHATEMLAAQIAAERMDIEAVRFDDSCNLRATSTEYPFLLLRQKPEPLYDVRFLGRSSASVWAYFAYVDGGFRFIGDMEKKQLGIREASSPAGSPPRIKLGSTVEQAKLIRREEPVYPELAQYKGLQGTVVLHAIIAKDGSVQNLYLDQGQCLLTQSAVNAIKKWRYSPTILNGEPVAVDTTIAVVFGFRPEMQGRLHPHHTMR